MIFRPLARKHLLLATALSLCLPLAVQAEGNPGAYLAATVANSRSDYAEAVKWYTIALQDDPANQAMLEGAILAEIGIGDMPEAARLSKDLIAAGGKSQIAAVALIADSAKKADFESILTQGKTNGSVGGIIDDLVKAWAKIGLGRMSEANEIFDKMAKTQGLEAFGLYHKALALASAGDFEGAETILSGNTSGTISLTRRGVVARIEILSQLERNKDAITLIDANFAPGGDQDIDDLRRRLSAGEPLPFTVARNATDGIAEVFFSMAQAVNGDANANFTLLHSRAAAYLRPDNTEAVLLTASLLEELQQFALAEATFATVPPTNGAFYIAEIGRADALRQSGQDDASLQALQSLARSHGQILSVQSALGEALRRAAKFTEAKAVFDTAIGMVTTQGPQHWPLFYARGVCKERTGDFAGAEADFRHALELAPDEPQVLNYLGYSLVDRGEKLDEALAMIQQAVARRPDSGAITDSLAWAYFRLGKYKEALEPMERASLLEPVDPVVTDHLGDVYWAVGRTREAQYQWRRALSFNPEEADATRIRKKLEIGLDAVLKEEAAAPKPATENAN